MSDETRPPVTRRDVLKKGAIATGGLVIGGAAFSGSAAAETPERIDLTGAVIPNPCTEDYMEVTRGSLQLYLNTVADGAGGFHLNGHLNLQGVQAEGYDGRMYQLNGSASVNANVQPPYPSVVTAVVNINVISQGAASNLRLQANIHITVNANGDLTVENIDFTGECVGPTP